MIFEVTLLFLAHVDSKFRSSKKIILQYETHGKRDENGHVIEITFFGLTIAQFLLD